MKRTQLIALALGIIIFSMGAATGVLAHRLYVANTVSASEDWRVRYVNEMHARLKLTNQQVDKLNDILDDTRAKVRAVKDEYKPEMLKIKDEQVARIRSILNPEQATAYVRIVAEQEQKAKEQDARDRRIEEQRALERQHRETNHSETGAN
jgi:predicted ribosome quality control (RQC) complex YloA/Tae2 family protein